MSWTDRGYTRHREMGRSIYTRSTPTQTTVALKLPGGAISGWAAMVFDENGLLRAECDLLPTMASALEYLG